MQKDVFGAEGDFTTSPEVSQVFGEVQPSPTSLLYQFCLPPNNANAAASSVGAG